MRVIDMSTHRSSEQRTIIAQLVASGSYADESEVIDRAIHLLAEHEGHRIALREKLQVGLDQIARGETVEYAPDFIDDLIQETEDAYLNGEASDPHAWP
jgi:putative addiction module CopG family antidote